MVDPISASLLAAGLAGSLEVGGFTVAYSSIAAYALIGGAVVGGAVLVNALTPKQHTDNQITVKQALPPRTRCYGRALLGGAYFFFGATSVLVSGFVLCEGPIDAFEEHWFSGQISPDGGALYGHADLYPWYQYIDFQSQLGTVDQQANGQILDIFGQYGDYSQSDRLRGLAVTVMRCFLPGDPSKNFSKRYPSGVPSYLARIRGSLVYDPRDTTQSWSDPATWKWSQNPAICILDYMTSSRGMNIPQTRIDVASFVDMANLCDEGVPISAAAAANEGYSAGILEETRYVLWGTYTLDEEPKTILERMLKTCDGEIYPLQDGTIGLRGGQWTPPTVTITPDIILSCDAKRGVDKLAAFNQLKIKTLSVANQFQVVEGDPWDDVAAQEASGEVLPQDFELVMCPSYTAGCRLAKIAMAKGNPAWLLNLTTNLAGLDALGERTIHVTYPDLSIDEDMFVSGFEIVDTATCKITAGSLSASAYQWDISQEGNPAPAYTPPPAAPYVPPAPTGLALSVGRVRVGSGYAGYIMAAITPPLDTALELVAQYSPDGGSTWIDMSVDNVAYTATSGYLVDGDAYEVRVALQTYGGSLGAYETGSVTITADATPPALPTNFSAQLADAGTAGPERVALAWTNSNSANFSGVRVYAGMDGTFADATLLTTMYGAPNASGSTTAIPVSGTNDYWITAINESGVASAPVGPVTVTL